MWDKDSDLISNELSIKKGHSHLAEEAREEAGGGMKGRNRTALLNKICISSKKSTAFQLGSRSYTKQCKSNSIIHCIFHSLAKMRRILQSRT
jgi:hypothetical protein